MVDYICKSPVLFLIFNRPNEAKRVFEAIRSVKPSKLYIAADGPRQNVETDYELCEETRKLISEVDWPCQVKSYLRTENLGCKIAVSEHITWFFDNEPEGIILEDDCLPNKEFFWFCDTLLEKYRDDTRIRHIGGAKMHIGELDNIDTYHFSRFTNIWGWASWRRVWENYDVNLHLLDEAIESKVLFNILPNSKIMNYFIEAFKLTKEGKINTWDYQYVFSNMINNGLSIQPNVNMISNIGFNQSATHTTNAADILANRPLASFEKIMHPNFVVPIISRDIEQVERFLPSLTEKVWHRLIKSIKRIINR